LDTIEDKQRKFKLQEQLDAINEVHQVDSEVVDLKSWRRKLGKGIRVDVYDKDS
jgi:hypothetical protein